MLLAMANAITVALVHSGGSPCSADSFSEEDGGADTCPCGGTGDDSETDDPDGMVDLSTGRFHEPMRGYFYPALVREGFYRNELGKCEGYESKEKSEKSDSDSGEERCKGPVSCLVPSMQGDFQRSGSLLVQRVVNLT